MSDDKKRLIANSKIALTALLTKYVQSSDDFVETLVKEFPEHFSNIKMNNGDEVIEPFTLVHAMNTYYGKLYDEFKQTYKSEQTTPSVPKPDATNVVDFSVRKKNTTTH